MEDSFNNPPQPTPTQQPSSASTTNNADNSHLPRPKRVACILCRRRKLRCDGKKPSCGTCARLGHECIYDEVRKKSGPKRGYVKQLEARLAQVETLLKGSDQPTAQISPDQLKETDFDLPIPNDSIPPMPEIPSFSNDMDISTTTLSGTGVQAQVNANYFPGPDADLWGNFEWDMISLGLEEPLPTQDVVDELNRIYFEKVHPAQPFLHPPRYFAAMDLAPHARPPIALRYIMWALAAVISDKYTDLHPHFYQRARKYAEREEMKGLGEQIVSLAYCQTWLLMAMYEFRTIAFPRAWLSSGKATRLAQMMSLHRVDGAGLEVKPCLPPPRDWTEREERRRVFWLAFCVDRYASIGTGWPMIIDERDIMTNLPASDESFIKSKPQQTSSLARVLSGEGIATLSSFASVAVLVGFFGRELTHVYRPDPQDNEDNLNGEFWKRHRANDNLLLHTALSAPSHLRLPVGLNDPNVLFWSMGIHAATICLHQVAIFKSEKNKLPSSIAMESKRRCIVAADQIASIMKMISHMDLTTLNPFMSFSVYLAGRVFAQYLKSRPDDSMVRSSLEFILSALNALKSKNPLTESFLVQLEVDLGATVSQDSGNPAHKGVSSASYGFKGSLFENTDPTRCAPLFTVIREPSSPATGEKETAPRTSRQTGHQRASLPNRHKGTTPGGSHMPSFNSSPTNFVVGNETGGRVMDVDFSSDFSHSERINPPSDHPTPSTMNSSSNTSISAPRPDYPSPPKSHNPFMNSPQAPVPPLGNSSQMDALPEHTTPDQFADIPPPNQFLSSSSEIPLVSTAADAPFSQSPWNVTDTQTSIPGGTGTTPGGIGSFDEAQWAQIFSSGNWESWGT